MNRTPINGSFYIFVKISFYLLCGIHDHLPPACKCLVKTEIDFFRFCCWTFHFGEKRSIKRTRRMPPVYFVKHSMPFFFLSGVESSRRFMWCVRRYVVTEKVKWSMYRHAIIQILLKRRKRNRERVNKLKYALSSTLLLRCKF